MPSAAYHKWLQFSADPSGVLPRFIAADARGDPDAQTIGRAVVVGLSSAWEAYVEEISNVIVTLLAWPLREQKWQEARVKRFNNPNVDNTLDLLLPLLGEDPWTGVCTPGRAEPDTRMCLNGHQVERHQVVHGQVLVTYAARELQDRLQFFTDLVDAVENRAHHSLQARLGHAPWT